MYESTSRTTACAVAPSDYLPEVEELVNQRAPTLPLFALMVKYRHEKIIAEALAGKGYEGLLPLQRSARYYGGRKRIVDLPVFPTYVFARFNPTIRLPILTIPGVFGIVGNNNGPIPVDEQEMAAITRICDSGLEPASWAFSEPGDPVVVVTGPLAGLTGTFVSTKSQSRLIISVSLLQRAVSVEMDASAVVPANQAKLYRMRLRPSAN